MYIIYKSRGGRRPSTVSAPIGQSNIWQETLARADDLRKLKQDREALQQKIEKWRGEQEGVRDRVQQHRRDLTEAPQQLQEVKEEITKRTRFEVKIGEIRDTIASFERECREMPALQNDLKVRVGELLESKMTINEKTLKAVHKLIAATRELDLIPIADQGIQNQLSELPDRLDEEKAKYAELEPKILDLNQQLKAKIALIKRKKEEAERACALTAENKEMMAELPDDLDVLKAELARLKTSYTALSHIDPTIAARFPEVEQKKAETQEKLDELQAIVEENEGTLMRKFNEWREMLTADGEN
jgi:chromosome segregation ATPase